MPSIFEFTAVRILPALAKLVDVCLRPRVARRYEVAARSAEEAESEKVAGELK